jgi:hypothetical protein
MGRGLLQIRILYLTTCLVGLVEWDPFSVRPAISGQLAPVLRKFAMACRSVEDRIGPRKGHASAYGRHGLPLCFHSDFKCSHWAFATGVERHSSTYVWPRDTFQPQPFESFHLRNRKFESRGFRSQCVDGPIVMQRIVHHLRMAAQELGNPEFGIALLAHSDNDLRFLCSEAIGALFGLQEGDVWIGGFVRGRALGLPWPCHLRPRC